MRSPRLEFIYNFTVNVKSELNRPHAKFGEVLAFGVSPVINDIKQFDENQTVVYANGDFIFLFRTPEGKGIFYLKEFEGNTKFDFREILTEKYQGETTRFCEYDYINKTTMLNITVDFETGTIVVKVNGKDCIMTRVSESIFSGQKATTLATGLSTHITPINLVMHEISISKMAAILTADVQKFTDSIQNMISTVATMDPDYYKNTSLSNVLMINVS